MPCISTQDSGPKKIGSYYEVNFNVYFTKKNLHRKKSFPSCLIKNWYRLFGFQPPKQHSDWRPALGYENVDVTPLPSHPTTNQLVQVQKTQQKFVWPKKVHWNFCFRFSHVLCLQECRRNHWTFRILSQDLRL